MSDGPYKVEQLSHPNGGPLPQWMVTKDGEMIRMGREGNCYQHSEIAMADCEALNAAWHSRDAEAAALAAEKAKLEWRNNTQAESIRALVAERDALRKDKTEIWEVGMEMRLAELSRVATQRDFQWDRADKAEADRDALRQEVASLRLAHRDLLLYAEGLKAAARQWQDERASLDAQYLALKEQVEAEEVYAQGAMKQIDLRCDEVAALKATVERMRELFVGTSFGFADNGKTVCFQLPYEKWDAALSLTPMTAKPCREPGRGKA